MSLSDFISGHHEAIIREFATFAQTLMPAEAAMTEAELRDHAEEILTALVQDMQLRQSGGEQHRKSQGHGAAKSMQASGRVHANDRILHGYTFEAVLAEFRALRASVLRLYGESGATDLGDVRRFNEAVDEALTESMGQFARQTDLLHELKDHESQQRERAEGALRAAAARDAYRLALTDALRAAADPGAAQTIAIRMLGHYLAASRVIFGEAESGSDDRFDNHHEYRRDPALPTSLGRQRLEEFGAHAAAEFRAGRTVAVNDVRADGRPVQDGPAFDAEDLRAFIGVPLLHEGRVAAYLAVQQATPHTWAAEEIALIEETAQRTWAAVDRARRELALRRSEEQLRTVAELVPDLLWSSAPNGDTPWYNQRWLDYTGQTLEEASGWGWSDVIHPDDRQRSAENYRRAVETATPLVQEHRIRRHDGVFRWFLVRAEPLHDETGAVERFYGAATDIHEQRAAAAALTASEQRHRLIVEGARDYAILTADAAGTITSWSPGAEAIFGWTAAEAVGQSLDMMFVPEDRAADVPAAERAQATVEGAAPDVRWHQCADGRRVFIDGTMRALWDSEGRFNGFLKVGQDVTRRREIDQAYRASEERLRAVIDSLTDYAIVSLDAGGRIVGWNDGARRLLGYDAAEVYGRTIDFFYTPEDVLAKKPSQELARAADTGRSEEEGWRLRKDGSRFWVNEIVRPLLDSDGRVTGFAKISRDLTERKAFEDALHEAHSSLEARVRERTAEVQSLFTRLINVQEEERRRIARDIHDQLGQQMTALRFNIEALRGQPDPPALSQLVDRIQRLAHEVDQSVDTLTWQLRPAALDHLGLPAALQHLVREWSERFGITAEFAVRGIEKLSMSPDAEANLYRIVQEGLHNIAKHAQATQVNVYVSEQDGSPVLLIEDDGRGFDIDAVSAPDGGRGMGLMNMRERAVLVGGHLDIESAPGHGTSIYVRLPAKAIATERP